MSKKVTDKQFEALNAIIGKRILIGDFIYVFTKPVYELVSERQGFLRQFNLQRYLIELTASYVVRSDGSTIEDQSLSDSSLKMLFFLDLDACRKKYLKFETQYMAMEKQFNALNQK
jgi:hypothetical protein